MPNIDYSLAFSTQGTPSVSVIVSRKGKSIAIGAMPISEDTTITEIRAWAKQKTIKAVIGFEAEDAQEARQNTILTHVENLKVASGVNKVTVTASEIEQEKSRILAEEDARLAEVERQRIADEEIRRDNV